MVISILGLLSALLAPSLGRAMDAARQAACRSNIRQMQLAFQMYLDDHDGAFFPFRARISEGTLWYWGLETGSGTEGSRALDKTRARLWPYLQSLNGVEICPSLAYNASYFKPKYEVASYGYALNAYLMRGMPHSARSGVRNQRQVLNPAQLIAWADSAQINTWQAPASPQNPMIEEWYYLDGAAPPKFHFRHGGNLSAAFMDGSVRSLPPHRLDPRCDGQVGYLEPPGQDRYLRTGP